MQLPDHCHAAHNPPAVAHIYKLLRPTIQPTIGQLPLTEPRSETIDIHQVESPCDSQRTYAREHLSSMRFCPRSHTVRTIKICTLLDVSHSLVNIYRVHQIKNRKCIEGAVDEASVSLSPLIAREGTTLAILQLRDICCGVSGVLALGQSLTLSNTIFAT